MGVAQSMRFMKDPAFWVFAYCAVILMLANFKTTIQAEDVLNQASAYLKTELDSIKNTLKELQGDEGICNYNALHDIVAKNFIFNDILLFDRKSSPYCNSAGDDIKRIKETDVRFMLDCKNIIKYIKKNNELVFNVCHDFGGVQGRINWAVMSKKLAHLNLDGYGGISLIIDKELLTVTDTKENVLDDFLLRFNPSEQTEAMEDYPVVLKQFFTGGYMAYNIIILLPFAIIPPGFVYVYCSKRRKNWPMILCPTSKEDPMSDYTLADFDAGLERNEFEVHYQPLFDLAADTWSGVEALLRWRCQGVLRAPGTFIKQAEACGAIGKLTDFVFDRVADEMRHTIQGNRNFKISINLPAYYFENDTLLTDMLKRVVSSDYNPENLILEWTESSIISNYRKAFTIVGALRGMRYIVALDDFGTQASNLDLLLFPFEIIKIDGTFIKYLDDRRDQQKQILLDDIITIIKHQKKIIVAEFVDTKEKAEFLRAKKVDKAQGAYFGMPMPARDLFQIMLARDNQ